MIHPRLILRSYKNLAKLITTVSLCFFIIACSTTPEVQDEIPAPPDIIQKKEPTVVKKASPTKKAVTVKKKAKRKPVKKAKVIAKKPAPKKVVKKKIVKKTPKPQALKKTVPLVIEKKAEPAKIQPPIVGPSFEMSSLPSQYGDNWLLNKEADGPCTLQYSTLSMEDGQGNTPVNLEILIDQITFMTKSNIDIEYQDAGLRVDENNRIPIESLYDENSISYKSSYASVIDEMKVGVQADLALGFWPTWPISQTYSVLFELQNFPEAYDDLVKCSQQ